MTPLSMLALQNPAADTEFKRIEMLVDALKGYQAGFNTSSYSTMGFLLLVLGWLVTSKEARAFLTANRAVAMLGIPVVIANAAVYVFMSFRIQGVSQGIHDRLAGMPAAAGLFEHYLLTRSGVWLYSIILGLVTVVLIGALAAIAMPERRATKSTKT